jgi:predicted TPR repeat methyltransferase
MFPRGVGAYVDLMQDLIPEMKDGTIRTAIDTGCGVSHILIFILVSEIIRERKFDLSESMLQ